eukprot:CAMPEP_0170289586 /NCGR_PEP_ID=MMETSP0116_2-20130129/44861_1 /TAXON_ID=400756 /ORGANISM="Durinskia baltica, Strain CSIRO CS-38" /LENGTH=514 /DNA_ID=CAMNT_0010541025 /DNA_START=1 /DNA_END=1545 /DNA_ORIENTATION=-
MQRGYAGGAMSGPPYGSYPMPLGPGGLPNSRVGGARVASIAGAAGVGGFGTVGSGVAGGPGIPGVDDGGAPTATGFFSLCFRGLCRCGTSHRYARVDDHRMAWGMDTNYTYSGLAPADLEGLQPQRSRAACCFAGAGVVALILVGVAAIVMLLSVRSTTTSTSTALLSPCDPRQEAGWSVSHRIWCCQHERVGCPRPAQPPTPEPLRRRPQPPPWIEPSAQPSPEFDCVAGWANWRAGWSAAKKAWCCQHQGKGCSSPIALTQSSCLIWGDPHIEGFDKPAHADFFFEGEVWLVKSVDIHIQARYKATPFTNGLAATDAIAVGGPFLRGHTITVGPLETGQISWDDHHVLQSFPSQFDLDGLGKIVYNDHGHLVDSAQSHLAKHIVHMDLPLGVHIQVMRWSHHINVRITMTPAEGGQDGHCGDFDGDASDDTTEQIVERIGHSVMREELLFHEYLALSKVKRLTLADCPAARRESARSACVAARADMHGPELASCVFDACFAGMRYARQDAVY